jgi:hypothetical protein
VNRVEDLEAENERLREVETCARRLLGAIVQSARTPAPAGMTDSMFTQVCRSMMKTGNVQDLATALGYTLPEAE